jgi:lysyl-tRNA synthetase class 1
MTSAQQPLFWSDQIAADIKKTKDKFIVSTGITPSGHIHIGNMREVLTADTVVRSLKELGCDVTFFYIADTFDPLRKVYPFLDAKIYEAHVGKPLSEIPGPANDGKSYAEHFLQPFLHSLEMLDIRVKLLRADQMYKEGKYVPQIIKALEATKEIKAILKKETGKEMESDWSPFVPICTKTGKMTGTKVTGFDAKKQTVQYVNDEGYEGEVSMSGGGKLTWRLDWPARWQILGVTFEPFGKDHATRGGSYDTGVRFAKEIFGFEPPHPAVYEWISLKGGGDMSSSKGNVISVAEMIDVVPPDVLKYSVMKVQPNKSIVFDPGLPLLNLIDEFDDPASKQRNHRAAELSNISNLAPIGVPFKHIVSLAQITQGNVDEVEEKLIHAGYPKPDRASLERRVKYAQHWLAKFGTEDMKFTLQKTMPAEVKNLSDAQKKALRYISENLKEGMDAKMIHELVYKTKEEAGLEPQSLFEAIYISLLAKTKGPRAGMFLASLDTNFVKTRFAEAGAL